ASRRPPRPRDRGRRRLDLELLETRDLLSATAVPTYVLIPHGGGGAASPSGTSGPTGYTPSQVRHAYGFDQITFSGGTVTGDGSGQTIAIVDAYDDPNIAADLATFDAQFGLPAPPSFVKATPQGTPPSNSGWAGEIALDVEWAH